LESRRREFGGAGWAGHGVVDIAIEYARSAAQLFIANKNSTFAEKHSTVFYGIYVCTYTQETNCV
jgi:hypothetical protein